jgi:hypothetical protein
MLIVRRIGRRRRLEGIIKGAKIMLTSYQQSHIDYVSAKYGNAQGFCGQIAKEIQEVIGGEITAGDVEHKEAHRDLSLKYW